ncbi:hypothetical protein LA080_008305 [Diaporthe eres]|nr:hypothetical protein LA080_008305 [Diaporthe eres]
MYMQATLCVETMLITSRSEASGRAASLQQISKIQKKTHEATLHTRKRFTAPQTNNKGSKFKKDDKILYGYEWNMKGQVDFVQDLGKGQYKYAITLDAELQTGKTNDIKSGLQDTAEWKSLSPTIPKQNVEEKDLKKAA